MTRRDGFPSLSARSVRRSDAVHREACATRSESLGKPPFRSRRRPVGGRRNALTMLGHRRRRFSYPTGRLRDLYGSLSASLGISRHADACWAAAGIDPGCDYCHDRCPRKGLAVTLRRGAGPVFDAAHCTGCGVCVHYCPSTPKALTLTAARDAADVDG